MLAKCHQILGSSWMWSTHQYVFRFLGMYTLLTESCSQAGNGYCSEKEKSGRHIFLKWSISIHQCFFTLGLISIVRKRRKDGWGCNVCIFFSSCTNHAGARCTFFNITQRPDRDAELIDFSAWWWKQWKWWWKAIYGSIMSYFTQINESRLCLVSPLLQLCRFLCKRIFVMSGNVILG